MTPVTERALIVVDMQAGAYGDRSGIPRMGGFAERVKRARRVVDRFRSDGSSVVFIREEHRLSLLDIGRELDGVEGIHCLEGDKETAIVAALGVREGDLIVVKRRYSAFFATELDLLLRQLGVRTVVIMGELTDVCVHLTFADAHQLGYIARVVADCCGGSSRAAHDSALAAMAYLQRNAIVTSSDLLLAPSLEAQLH